MKNFISIIVCLIFLGSARGQVSVETESGQFSQFPIKIEEILSKKGLGKKVLVGIGDIGQFAKESKLVSGNIMSHLIKYEGYRNILLHADDWSLRPLNEFLQSPLPNDRLKIDSLIKLTFSNVQYRNTDFSKVLYWLKDYNLTHAHDKVNVYGVASTSSIPSSYFLTTYIFQIDNQSGMELSRKWTDNFVTDSITLSDIKLWVNKMLKSKISPKNRDIINSCLKDLDHNEHVLNIKSVDQKFTFKKMTDNTEYTASKIISKLDQKSIYYSSNYDVIKTSLQSDVVVEKLPRPSVGFVLNQKLKEKYYVVITDFSQTSELTIVDSNLMNLEKEKFLVSDKVRELSVIKDVFDSKLDAGLLNGYKPIVLPTVMGLPFTSTHNQKFPIFDLLLIVKKLSTVDFLN